MRAMMTTARMTAAANAVEGFFCADMVLLPDAVMASVFVILGILGILGLRGLLLALVCLLSLLSLVLRHTAAGPKDTRFA